MSLFPEIDNKQTSRNVRLFFENDVPKLEQTAGTFLKTVRLSSQPSGDNNINSTLENITRQVWARDQLDKVMQAFSGMDEELANLIQWRYFDHSQWWVVADKLNCSERLAQKKLHTAFIAFAYGYHGEAQLLVELNGA
jgi:ArpU family phage transcriptional regulator